jgi:hypothetical protein
LQAQIADNAHVAVGAARNDAALQAGHRMGDRFSAHQSFSNRRFNAQPN